MDVVAALLHWWLVFALLTALVSEMNLCRGELSAPIVKRLAIIDGVYGASAVLLLIVGLMRALHGPKGWAFYSGNPMFWIKIAVFLLIALLSIIPTLRILAWRKIARQGGTIPASAVKPLRGILHAELMLVALLPIFGVLMARGIGI